MGPEVREAGRPWIWPRLDGMFWKETLKDLSTDMDVSESDRGSRDTAL